MSKQNDNETKPAEQKIDLTHRSKVILETSIDGFCVVGLDGKLLECNSSICDITGYSKEEFIKMKLSDIEAQMTPEEIIQKMDEIKRKGYGRFETKHFCKDGRIIDIDVSTKYCDLGADKFFFVFSRDITNTKLSMSKLQKSEILYKTLCNNIPGMVYRGRSDWSTEIISNSETVCGYFQKDINSNKVKWLDIIHPDDRERILNEASKLEDKSSTIIQEYRIIAKDGSVRWVEDHKTSTFTKKGVFDGVDGIVFDITERKLTEDAFKESEDRFESIVSSVPGLVYRCKADKNWTMIYFSKETEVITGYPVSDFIGNTIRTYASVIHPDDTAMVVKIVFDAIKKKKSYKLEYRIIRKNGEIKWVLENGKGVFDTKGKLLYLDGVIVDITERKRNEEIIHQTTLRWRREADIVTRIATSSKLADGEVYELAVELTEAASAALEVERVGVWIFEEDETKLVNTDNYVASTGKHSSGAVLLEHEFQNEFTALRNVKYVDAHDPLTDPRTAGYVEGYLKPGKITSMLDAVIRSGGRNLGTLCFEHVNKSHHWEDDEITFACQLADQVALAISNHAQKKIEEELQESEHEKALVLDNTGEIIAYHDTNHNLQWANKAYLEATGLSLQELKGRKCYLAWGLKSHCNNCPVTKAIETGKPQEIELTPQNQENWPANQGYWLSRAAPVKDSTGNIIGGIEIAYDITEKKQLESEREKYKEQVLNAQRHAYIGSMGAIVAHQVNQPLTKINILLDRAIEQLEEASCSPIALKDVKKSLDEAKEATSIIRKFRQYSKDSALEDTGKVNVNSVANRIITVLSERTKQAKMRISIESLIDLPEVETNETALEQVFLIIVQNAIEASDGRKLHKLDITGKLADDNVELQFADDCCGIAPENLERIFEPFFSTKTEEKGMGLGLDIVQQILINCGGQISVESELDKGTTFYVTIPISNAFKP